MRYLFSQSSANRMFIWPLHILTLIVPDEGYYRNVPDEGYYRNVPDEGYYRNASCALN
jgi:hypothetical protein